MALKCCYKNILETGTVTLSAGTEDPAYPLYRLYDRNVGRFFKPAAAVTIEVKVDQGAAGNLAVDRLLIPPGHNLSGMTLDIKWSDDDALYTAAVPQWVQADNLLIEKSWASITHRYWKFIITAPASIPQVPELFLSPTLSFSYDPDWGWSDAAEPNEEVLSSSGGRARVIVFGVPLQSRQYRLDLLDSAEKESLKAFRDAVTLAKGFFIYDMIGSWYFVRFNSLPGFESIGPGLWACTLDLIEQPGG